MLSVEKTLEEAEKLKSLDNSTPTDSEKDNSTPTGSKDEKIVKVGEIPDVQENGTSKEQILQNEGTFIEQTLDEVLLEPQNHCRFIKLYILNV